MKTLPRLTASLATFALSVSFAQAATYFGSGVADGGGASDGGAISSVVVNNTASTISFTINSTMPMSQYIFYSVQLQYGPGGDTSLINPWTPHVGISTGENAMINTYNNAGSGGGGTAFTFGGGTWTGNSSVIFDAGGTGLNFATITVPLSSLGLSVGTTFNFDVVSSYTNPGGQAAYGALDYPSGGYIPESDNNYQPWNGTSYYDSATAPNFAATTYTVVAVPEPGTGALLTLASLFLARRALRRSA
jgi:hypothetical protein